MIPYLLLIIVPLIGCFIVVEQGKIKIQLYLGNSNVDRANNLALPSFFVILFFLLAFRDVSIGNDTMNYKHYFELFSKGAISSLVNAEVEVLYALFNWLIGKITDNFQCYLAIVAAVSLIPIASLYMEDRRHSYLKIVLFLNMSTFVMLFSGIRQAIAFAMGLVTFRFVKKKKIIAFLLCVILTMGMHQSAFILLAMYPLYHATLDKKHLFFIVPMMIVLFVFNGQVFAFLMRMIVLISPKYANTSITPTGAVTMLILFIVFAIFSYLIPDEEKVNEEIRGLRNFLLLTIIIQCFAPLHTLAMRMNYYYILFIPVLITEILSIPRGRYKQMAMVAESIMSVFFTGYFIFTLISSLESGGVLNTVPYVPFWR